MNINTINDMIDTLLRAKALLGGNAPFAVVNDNGFLKLARSENIIISNGNLIVDASDWGGVQSKTWTFKYKAGEIKTKIRKKVLK